VNTCFSHPGSPFVTISVVVLFSPCPLEDSMDEQLEKRNPFCSKHPGSAETQRTRS